jgi:hypothetical protein
MTVVNGARFSFLALWLGAALFFSAVVAPSVFSVLRSFQLSNANEIAGTIVTRTLAIINGGGLLIGLLSLAAILVFKRSVGRGLFGVEVVSLTLLVIATMLGQWVIAARMLALRTAMVIPIDQIAADDPRRIAFNSLHHYSVASLGVAMLAAIVAMIVIMKYSYEKID